MGDSLSNSLKTLLYTLALICFCCNYANADEGDDEFLAFESQLLESKTKIYDPLEPLNRKIFAFNDIADKYFLGYLVSSYRVIIPKPARNGIRNFFNNLSKPFSAINSFAQGKTDNGLASLSSFIINSTVGIFGFMDVAKEEEIVHNDETFGQTLGYYGVGPGPYLVLPFIGPSTTRELSSDIAESAISPIGFDALSIDDKINISIHNDTKYGLTFLEALDRKESFHDFLKETKKDSFDYYATIRSFYLQNLQSNIQR